jgi:hypothetical protein
MPYKNREDQLAAKRKHYHKYREHYLEYQRNLIKSGYYEKYKKEKVILKNNCKLCSTIFIVNEITKRGRYSVFCNNVCRKKYKNKIKNLNRKDDPIYKIFKNTKKRIKEILNEIGNPNLYKKANYKINLLGVKKKVDLIKHLESLFKPGMSFNNYGYGEGKWVIDHKIPIKYFKDNYDLANDIKAQKKCFGIKNLQPLWFKENQIKSDKLIFNVR